MHGWLFVGRWIYEPPECKHRSGVPPQSLQTHQHPTAIGQEKGSTACRAMLKIIIPSSNDRPTIFLTRAKLPQAGLNVRKQESGWGVQVLSSHISVWQSGEPMLAEVAPYLRNT